MEEKPDFSYLQANKTVVIPGGVDKLGRPLFLVTVPQGSTILCIKSSIKYLFSIFSDETKAKGFTVILDARKGSWKLSRLLIKQTINSFEEGELKLLLVLRPDGFWDQQRIENCTVSQEDQEVIFVSRSRLGKFVDQSQLPVELGGGLIYNHDKWIENRQKVEEFYRDAKAAIKELEELQHVISSKTLRPSQVKKTINSNCGLEEAAKLLVHNTTEKGKELVQAIEYENRTRKLSIDQIDKVHSPQDTLDTIEKIHELVNEIRQKQQELNICWTEIEKDLISVKGINELKKGVVKVTNWILGTAEELMNQNQKVGHDVASAEEVRKLHESIELQCLETYGSYAEILHKINTISESDNKDLKEQFRDLISQKEFMDFVCKSFALRVEKRRNILITSLRFFRLVSEYFDRTSEVFDLLVVGNNINDFDTAASQLKELQINQFYLDTIAQEINKEGEKLSDMLSMPIKDALGQEIKTDYSEDIINIHDIIDATLARKNIFSDNVELQKLTLQQITLIDRYEKDAQQAITWLEDILMVMLKDHSYVGCTVHEIQTQKEEHQAFQDTAKCTYHYGCQLLNASFQLRQSCKLPIDAHSKICHNLHSYWSKIDTISQEQMTRLRVSAVFHRSVEEHCNELRDMREAVATIPILNLDTKREQLEKYIEKRENLMMEVGRMVRLGRLLRSRLKEPLYEDESFFTASASFSVNPDQPLDDFQKLCQNSVQNNEISIEAISEKLLEVTQLSEELDQALRSAQQDYLVFSTASTASTEDTIIDGSTFLKEDSSMDRSQQSEKSDEEFLTASDTTLQHSRSSSYNTASENEHSFHSWWKQEGELKADIAKEKMVLAVGCPPEGQLPPPQEVLKSSPEVPPGKIAREVIETTHIKVQQQHNFGVKSFVLSSEIVKDVGATGETSSQPSLIKHQTDTETKIYMQSDEAGGSSQIPEDLLDKMKQCGDWINLKILEITPELTTLGNTLAEALQLQSAHNEVLRQLQTKQSPVEELLRQADQLIATQRPRAEVYAAMAESLGRAWRDINATLELRKVILDLNVQYHTKAQEFFEKNDALEAACSDPVVPVDIEAVKTLLTNLHDLRRLLLEALMVALQSGNSLLGKLKELGAEGTLDSRPERLAQSINKAISQVQGWLDELHIKRQILETMFTKSKTQLEQCLAIAILAADLKELDQIIRDRSNLLASSNQLGDSSSSAELLLHEHRKLLPEAKQLQERALKITKATEELVFSGCFAGTEASQQSYQVLSSSSDYLADLQKRESLLERVIAFFRTAQTVLAKLDQLEIQLKATDLPKSSSKLADLHAHCAKTVEDTTTVPISEGYAILDLAGHSGATEGVKKMIQELENMKIILSGLCTAHREENKRLSLALNNFYEKHDEIYNWLVTIAEAFLQGHQDTGGDLRLAEDFLQLHNELQVDLQTKGNEINQLLLTLPPILEYLEDDERRDVDSKVEGLHNRWMKLKSLIENRLQLARIYVKFHMEADIVNREMDNLEASLQGKETVDEETMKVIEEKFESIVPYFQSAKNTGLTFISELKRITEPHLDTQRARKYVESVLERLSSRQLNVTKSWQTFRDETVEKREILVRLEKTMAESTRTISWVSKLDSQLYPVLTTLSTKPSEIAAFLEHKLETVLPDIRKAQGEVGQKLKSAEELIVKAGATDEKTLTIKEKLNELSQKLAEIASEYQILLQVLCGYFKSLEEIDKKIDTFNAQLEKVRLPKDLQQVELTLRESEITKETILERFRFSQTECEHIEQRIRKQEPPQSAEHDIRKLYYVLELRKSDFEKQWRHKYDVLKTHRTFGEFIKEAQEVKNSIQEVDRQISEVKTKCTESLSVSKAVSDHFKQFTRVTESLDLRIIKLKEKGEAVEKECPLEAASIQNELYEIQAEWSETKEKLQKTQKNLDKSVKYFELIDEANDWLKEGNKLQVLIARKSTSIKQPIEATQLLEEIKSFLDSGEIKQSQRIQEILNLSNQIGMLDNSRHAPIVNGNKEMLDSFASISSELQQLSRNLISAEQERLKRLEEQKKAEREAEARRLEEQRLAQEKLLIEQKRLAEEARLAEEHRKVEEERLQQEKLFAEEQLRAAKAKLAEEARLTKERGLAEEKRLAEEARLAEEHRREQEALLAEEARKVEVAKLEVAQLKMQQMQFLEDAKRAEAERRRFEEEELKKLEAARHADEVRRLEEAKRLEEERRRLEELQMIEQERLQKEQIKLEMEKLRLEEEKIRAEQARLEEERRLAEQRRIEEENLKAQRAKLDQEKLEAQQAKIDEEQRRLKQAQLEEEAREAELSKIKAMREAEEARLEELRKAEQARLEEFRRQEEARIADEARRREEAKRLEEEKRRLEKAQMIEQERIKQEHIKLEAEKQRLEEERLRAEQARLNEEKKLAEQRRIEEEKLKAQKAKLDQERIEAEKARLEEEKRRLKQAQLDEEAREAEMARIKAMREAEEARLEELRKAEQARLEDLKRQEEARLADEVRRLEEVKRLEDEKRKLDEAQLIEQNRLKQEHIKLEAEKQRLEEERLRAERARLEEEKRLAEQRKVEEENLKAQKAKLEQEKLEAEQARLQEEKRRLKQVQLDEEARKAEMARIKAMREAEEARLEELRKAEQARIEDLRKQEDEERQRRFEDERVRLERERIESQKIIHEIHTTETHTKELFIKEKSPIVEEPHELPVFTTPLSDVVVQEGSKVSFICQVTGHPNPNITWFKSGVPIQHNPDYNTAYDNGNCSLTIEETFAEDSAKYTCKATNAAGTAETSAVLTVNETEPEEQLIAPSFVRLLQPAVAKEGATFQFECKVEGNPLPTVQWFKNKECIDNSPNYCITYNNGEAILKFDKVTLDDKADYICKASSQLGTAQSTANLIVTSLEPVEPPVFTTTLSNVMARAGQKIKLECEVAGLPSPILTWSHNGKALKETREIKLQFEGNKSSLIVQEAFPKDAGTYTVTAKNIVGEASSSSVVSVKGRLPIETSDSELASDMEPVKPSIQLPLVNTTVKEGSEICLDCIIVGQPEPEVIWYHDGRPVKESPDVQLLFQGDRCSLVIKDALPEDSGEYKVVALNSAGEASSQCILSVEAKELDAPEGSSGVAPKLVKLLSDVLASEGDEVILQGNVTGEPKPELKWLLNNVPITDADHFKTDINDNGDFTLKIQNVRAEDRGVYTVKASNPSGEAKCFAQLIVKSTKLAAEAKPYEEVKSAPVFREMFYDRTAFTDSPTKFECIVSGKPAPKVKWLFNGSPISGEGCLISTSGDRQVLSIPNVKPEHQGTITCVAENEEGKATCSASLTVQSSLDLALPEQSVQMSLLPTDTKSHVETSYSVNREVITQSSTSSSSKIITSSTSEPQTEEHKTVLQQSQIFKQVNQDAPQIQKSQRVEEYHKVGNEAPVISEKTFVIGDKDDSSQIKVIDQQQIVVKPIKMVRAPKWVSPVIGKIIDQHVDVVLEGILDGQPTPKVTWTKDGRELVEDDRVKIKFSLNKATVEIKNANVGDAGRYSCTATNGAGTAVSTADLVVRKTIFPPVFGRRLQAQVIKKNDRLIMEVEVTGTPEPTITWFKDGVLVKDALGTEAKIKSIGQSHQLILDKADLKHSGRYMVRATNAGGEAQSIADIAVYEPTPDTMVEVVKTVVFEDVKKHETLASTSDKTSSTIEATVPIFPKTVIKPKTEIAQSYTCKSETLSSVEQKTSQQSQTFKLEHKMSDIPMPKRIETPTTSSYEKHTDYEICHGISDDRKQELIEEKKNITEEAGIETSSISKESSLQYFVKKIKEGETAPPLKEDVPVQPLKPDIYKSFLVESEDKKETFKPTFIKEEITEKISSLPANYEYKTFSNLQESSHDTKPTFIKEQITQKISSSPIDHEYKTFSTLKQSAEETRTTEASKPYLQEFSSYSSVQQVSEPQEYKSHTSEITREFGIKPEPTAKICSEPIKHPPPPTSTLHEMKSRQELAKPFTKEYSSYSSTQQVSQPQEYKASSSEIIHEFSIKPEPPAELISQPAVPTLPKPQKSISKPFTQQFSSYTSTQQISQPQEYKAHTTEIIREFGVKPEPAAEICSQPIKPSSKPFKQQFSSYSSTKEVSEPHKFQSQMAETIRGYNIQPEPPATICHPPKIETCTKKESFESTSGKKEFSEKIEKSYQSSSYQTSSSSYSRNFETTSSPIFMSVKSPIEKIQTTTKSDMFERPASVASSSYSAERHSYNRPLSAMSGEPSYEALQMEKQWAHKFSDIHSEKSSQSTSLQMQGMLPAQRVQENRTFLDKTPVQVPHYIGEVTRLETTLKDQKSDSHASQSYEQQSTLKSSWAHVPPPTIDSLSIRPVSVQDITNEVILEPGSPPEIAYAQRPSERRRSYVETIEHELEHELQREPSKVLPCAVRTIPPPPLPPKKEFPQAPPLPARPVKFVESKPKKMPGQSPFQKFPDLEPFPFKPDPEKPRPTRTGPPPKPSKFIKGKFTDSDYESDFEAVRIPPKWKPSMSDTEEPRYKRVRPPQLLASGRARSQEPEPLPPSKFDHPPQFQGPPRPEVDFDEFRRKKDSTQIKKMTKHFEQLRREASPPKLQPASPPVYVVPEKKPDSPKLKKKVVIDGYMADTDEPFQQQMLKTEHFKEEKIESHISSQNIFESTSSTQKFLSPKSRVSKVPTKKHYQSAVSSTKKEFIATPIITSQTTQQFSEEHQKQTQLQYEQHYQADHKKAPPTPTPSKFIKGEFRESDYESDYEGRPSQIWGETSKKEFKPVKPVLTPTPVIGQQPTTNHISSTQPDRPKFQPIEKITPVLKPAICKPKPLTGAPITDVIVAKPAVPFIQPGTPPEMGYASRPRKTQQYYRSTTSGPYQNAIQTETSNIVHLDESTDTCKRTMSVQQTHKVIKFGDQYRKHEQSKLEPLPFSPEPERPRRSTSVPPPPTPSKFIPGEFRESDYESEVESAKIKPKWVPGGSDTEDLHYRKVKAPTPSREYNAHTSQRQTVVTPMEFDRGPIQTISTTTTGDYTDSTSTRQFRTFSESSAKHIMKRSNSFEPPAKVKPGTSPEYGTINNQKTTKKTATKLATHHIDSMTKDFKSKTQQFVQDVVNDVNKKQAKKPILKGIGDGDAQVYREETRNLSSGTKHVDPDTGLIYFKYDFGYEFGIILPGESKAGEIPVPKKTSIEPPKRTVDIEMPVYHESSQPDHVHSAPTPQFKPKKFTNKWDPTSESEMSEYDEPKRKFGLTAQGSRWEPSSCSPYSLSPSLPSTSPACNFPFADRAQTPPSRASTPGSSKIVIHPGQPRPPMFITPLRDIAVVSGQTAKFECIVQSEPPAEILWSKDGRIIQDSNSHQIYYRNGVCRLTISPAYPENAGSYTCTATNSVSSTNATAMLQVAGEIRSQYLK